MSIVLLDDSSTWFEPGVVCLGYFDGVHLGHAALIERACDIAKANNLKVYTHTFNIPPSRKINPGRNSAELTPLKEKAKLLETLGVNTMAVSTFDENIMKMPGKDFINEFIYGRMHAVHIVAGFHHVFGYHGDTDATALKKICALHNIGCEILPPVKLQSGELISSTAIRKALEDGDFIKAEQMLGRPCDAHMMSFFKRNIDGGNIV